MSLRRPHVPRGALFDAVSRDLLERDSSSHSPHPAISAGSALGRALGCALGCLNFQSEFRLAVRYLETGLNRQFFTPGEILPSLVPSLESIQIRDR
jgi:hypothetical protein